MKNVKNKKKMLHDETTLMSAELNEARADACTSRADDARINGILDKIRGEGGYVTELGAKIFVHLTKGEFGTHQLEVTVNRDLTEVSALAEKVTELVAAAAAEDKKHTKKERRQYRTMLGRC